MSPLLLEINFSKVFIAGVPSSFEYRLTNTGGVSLYDTRLTLVCPLLDLTGAEWELGTLHAGGVRAGTVEVSPRSEGIPPLRCGISTVRGREEIQLEGEAKRVRIHERPQSPSNISVIIQDIQSHRSEGEKAEFGSVKGDVNISVTDLLPRLQSLNDLLMLELPEDFQPVSLRSAPQRIPHDLLFIPEPFLRVYEPAETLQITPSGDAAGAAGGWRLCGGGLPVILGRSSQDADLVTRFPGGVDGNAKSALLSRRHAALRIDAEGGMTVESLAPHAAMRVGMETARAGVPHLVPSGGTVALGQVITELRLRLTVRRPPSRRFARIVNLTEWIGHRPTMDARDDQDWGHLEIAYLNAEPACWTTLCFQRRISFGTGVGDLMRISAPGAARTHGWFHHLRGCFWVECATDSPSVPEVDGVPLTPGGIAPLRNGAALTLAGREHTVHRVR